MIYQREAPNPIRVGVVGVGSHCYRNILPTLAYLPMTLVAVADPHLDRAEVTARQYGAKPYAQAAQMYEREELDAVLLAVSPHLHPSLAIEAFAAGLHVWLEKPVAVRAFQVEEMIAARKDLISVVGLKKAFMPATVKAREIVGLPDFGRLRSASGVYSMDIPEDGGAVLRDMGTTNKWLVDGCHPMALLLAVAGPAEAVTVKRSKHGGGFCIVDHAGGAVSSLHLAEGIPRFQPSERYTFIGDERSVQIENTRRVVYQRGIEFSYVSGTSFAPTGLDGGAIVWEAQDGYNTLENKAVVSQGLYGALDHFCQCILAGTSPLVGSLEFALGVSQLYEAALVSAGQTVQVTTRPA